VNAAEQLLRTVFRFGEPAVDVFSTTAESSLNPATYIHADAWFSLFGPSGAKELLVGRDAFLEFVRSCTEALADRTDEIIAITGIDEECALVHASAWRKSKASGEELRYEWTMLYRVENGLVTYGVDMLDSDAQAFWGRIRVECCFPTRRASVDDAKSLLDVIEASRSETLSVPGAARSHWSFVSGKVSIPLPQ
jgi:hypothetical protein